MSIWPIELSDGDVGLRPLRYRDAGAWRRLRQMNREWLAPWEATTPDGAAPPLTFRRLVRSMNQEARAGRALPFAITVAGVLQGQISVVAIGWGSLRSAHIGYWVSREVAGHGVAPTSVALVTDYLLLRAGLHRVEINIRPENTPSLRVVQKLGFRDEGVRRRFLHIDGAWRDHRTFALTTEDLPATGLLAAYHAQVRAH